MQPLRGWSAPGATTQGSAAKGRRTLGCDSETPSAYARLCALAAALLFVVVPVLSFAQEAKKADQKQQKSEAKAEPQQDGEKKSADEPATKKEQFAEKPAETKDNGKDDAKQADQKKATKPARNPLSDLIKRSLPAAAEPAKPAKNPRGGSDRAPYEKKADDWMHKARAHIEAGEWEQALELLQKLAELPEDTLYRNEAGKWVSMHDEVLRLRGDAPPPLLGQYRVQFGGLAKQLLADADRSGDLAALGRIARTYFHTDAGYEAANRLGSLHLDRGEFALAAHWFMALWQARPPVTKDPLWRTKAAYALKQAGNEPLSRELLEQSPAGTSGTVGLGGRSFEPEKWLAGAAAVPGAPEEALSDWPLFYGTPRRTGIATGGEPLLLPRWRVSTTDSLPVRAQIEHLVEDLSDQGTPVLPVLFPTMVGGKVVFRTLHGVQVIDAESGRPLWQTDESQPLEKMIAGTALADENGGGFVPEIAIGRGFMRQWNMGFNSGSGENSALCHLLFRNANFGLISSDGQQLFVVDDPEYFANRQPENLGAFGETDSSAGAGRLTSYDLGTGRPLWEIGGPANGEPFDLSLAGYFFFGPPAADGGELFAVGEATVGEADKEVRLVCLDPRSGAKKWSQLLALSDPGIDKDLRRRWWTAQVAVGDGILVCPTTVGWLIAVDRATHSILWGYRSAVATQGPRHGPGNEGASLVQYAPLGNVWGPAPPVISQGRVIFTPPETQLLVCLDQSTGKELWTKPRGHGQYLGGVFEKNVVVVARDAVTAFKLESGEQAWTIKILAPSGRGVTVADRMYLPLSAGEVWSIDLKKGQVNNRWNLPPHVPSVGNLAMYRGMLLSVDPFGLTAFEQREAIQNEIERRKKDDPRDAWALLHEAEIRSLEHDLPTALAALRQVRREKIPTDLKESFREQLVRTLTATIRKDLARPETEADLAELESAIRKPDEQQALGRLRAELFVARGEHVRAFDAYLALAENPVLMVSGDDVPLVRVRSDLWVAGKLADLREKLNDADRQTIEARVAALGRQALESEDASKRFLILFRGQPGAAQVRRALAEKYAARGEFLRAERLFSQLARGEGRDAADATERLARLMLEFSLPADAAWYYRELETRFGATALAGGASGAQHVKALRDAGRFPDVAPPVLDWHADSVRVERMGAVYSNYVPQDLSPDGSSAPFFSKHRFEVEHAAQRLEVIDGLTDDVHWSLPLRSKAGTPEGGLALSQASGHHLTLLHRGVLHSLSPVDRKVLWTRPLETRAAVQNVFGRTQMPLQPMQQAVPMARTWQAALAAPAVAGALSLASEEFIGYQGRRSATLLDALTGETCWSATGVRPGTLMLGGEEVVYLKPHEGQPVALRATDGKRLEIKKLGELLSRAIHAVGDSFVLSGTSGGKTTLRLHHPLHERDVWSIELPKGTVLSMLENDRMAVLESDGKFSLLDLRSGEKKLLGTLSEEDLKSKSESYALADNVNAYLVINKGANQNYYSEQVPFVRANGLVLAFDIQAGKQRWKQSVRAQNLMLERLTFSPFLVFSSRKYEQKGKLHYWSLHLLAIDKISGAKLLDEKSAAQPGFRAVNVSAGDRYVELRSYNERVRLYPEEKSAAAGQSGG